jgi:hypothetical protein
MLRKIAIGALAVIAAFAVLLAAAVALVFATLRIERIASPAPHAASVGAELVFGAAALLAAVYIATRIAVRVFATSSASDAAHAAPSNYPASPSQLPRT